MPSNTERSIVVRTNASERVSLNGCRSQKRHDGKYQRHWTAEEDHMFTNDKVTTAPTLTSDDNDTATAAGMWLYPAASQRHV